MFSGSAIARMTLDEMLNSAEKLLEEAKQNSINTNKAIEEFRTGNTGEFYNSLLELGNETQRINKIVMDIIEDKNYYAALQLLDAEKVKFEKTQEALDEIGELMKDSAKSIEALRPLVIKRAAIGMMVTIFTAAESYRIANKKFPDSLDNLMNSSPSSIAPLEDSAIGRFYTFLYKLIDADHYELQVMPKPDVVNQRYVLKENCFLDQAGEIVIKDPAGQIIETISVKKDLLPRVD
jgi:hypothetical protein